MITEYKFYVGFKDINSDLKLKNSSMLTFFENVAGMHATTFGDGFKETVTTTHTTWLLLSWKAKVIKRPELCDNVIARTWVKEIKRVYSYREFELVSEEGELLAVCSSKWVKIDFEKGLPARRDPAFSRYEVIDKTGFPGEADEVKIDLPTSFITEYSYKIPRDWIDMNYHLNNTRYLTLAQYAFVENKLDFLEFDSFEIVYKKEVKFGETVKCRISEDADGFTLSVFSEDETVLHALLRFHKG